MKQVSQQVKGFSGLVKKNSVQIKRMGRTMMVAGTAIVAAIGAMVKAYGNFDEAMVKSLAIMGDISPAMRKQMAETAKQLSTTSTFAAKELADAYYFLASAGMNAEQSIAALEPVARFAQAGAFDLALATDLLTDAQTALGLSSKNAAENQQNLIRVSDVLVGANTLANASVMQFSEALTNKAAAALVNVNKEVEEGVAVLAAYADKGVKGRLAGQRLTMMLNGLFDAARNNKEAWDGIGISLFNADGSMRAIAAIIADLEVHLGKMTVQQREAELAALGFNIKTKDSILTLMGSSEKIKTWTKNLKEMGGITKKVSDKQLKAFNAQMTLLKNTVIKAVMPIGKALVPTIEKLAVKIKSVAEKIERWVVKNPKLTAIIVKFTAAIGALLIPLGAFMMILPGLIAALPAFKVALASLLGPLGAIIAAAIAAGIAINALIENYKDKQDAEIAAIMKGTNDMARFLALRKKLIKDEVVTVDEWAEIYAKHGRSYKRTLRAIALLPEYAHIKKAWDEIIEKHEEVEESLKEIPAPAATAKIGTIWTTIGNIFHDVSVRVAEMQGKIKNTSFVVGNLLGDFEKGFVNINMAAVKAAKLPPFAVNIPKMSLKDLRDYYMNWLKEFQDKWKFTFERVIAAANLFTTSLGSLFSQMHTNEIQRIENEYQRRKEIIDASLMSDQAKYFAIEKLDRKMDKERLKAQRAQAKRTKALSLMEAIVNTASGVAQALKAPFPLNLILPAIIGAMGAAQIALIAAQPLPTFAKGGRIEEAGIVGERGPEIFAPGRPGEIIPIRERAPSALGPTLTFAPAFYLSTLDPQTARDVVRDQIGPELLEMFKTKIMLHEFQDALKIR